MSSWPCGSCRGQCAATVPTRWCRTSSPPLRRANGAQPSALFAGPCGGVPAALGQGGGRQDKWGLTPCPVARCHRRMWFRVGVRPGRAWMQHARSELAPCPLWLCPSSFIGQPARGPIDPVTSHRRDSSRAHPLRPPPGSCHPCVGMRADHGSYQPNRWCSRPRDPGPWCRPCSRRSP